MMMDNPVCSKTDHVHVQVELFMSTHNWAADFAQLQCLCNPIRMVVHEASCFTQAHILSSAAT